MRQVRESGFPTVSRRHLVAGAAGCALAGLGFGAVPAISQVITIDATPGSGPALPAAAPPAGETVAERAQRLDYDLDTIVAFVRDEIAYEAYDGILRGAQGTLAARAGNSADQAMLLAALLDSSAIPYRFATAPLDPPAGAALIARLARTRDTVEASWTAAGLASLLHALDLDALPAAPPTIDPELLEMADLVAGRTHEVTALASASAAANGEAISGALAAGGVTLPPLAAAALPVFEQQHLWVQVADGADWIDIDPSLPSDAAIPGPPEPIEAPPDDWHHQVRFAIVADEWMGSTIASREVVSLKAASARLVDVPVALSLASANELTDLGSTVTQSLSGQKTIYPSIYADGTVTNPVKPVIFATDAANAQDPFGGTAAGPGVGETIALWLQVDVTPPGGEPVVIRRPLLDRLAPADRASGTIAADRIAPVHTVPTSIGDDTVEEFNRLTLIHIDVARIPPNDAVARSTQDAVFGPLGMLGPSLSGLREMLGLTLESDAGIWSWPTAPNITIFTISEGVGDHPATVTTDLVYRQRAALPLADVTVDPGVHPLVLAGILDAVAEQALLAPGSGDEPPGSPVVDTGISVAAIFQAASKAGQTPRLVTGPDDLAGFDLDPVARARLEAELAAGNVVVMPAQPVDLGAGPVLGWWIVDPASGHTRDELESGIGGATSAFRTGPVLRFGNAAGYTLLDRAIAWFVAHARAIHCVGRLVFIAGLMCGAFALSRNAAAAGDSDAATLWALAGAVGGPGAAGAVAAWSC